MGRPGFLWPPRETATGRTHPNSKSPLWTMTVHHKCKNLYIPTVDLSARVSSLILICSSLTKHVFFSYRLTTTMSVFGFIA